MAADEKKLYAKPDTMPPLPEPDGFRTRYRSEPGMIGHYPWTYADQRRRREDRPEWESEDLFVSEKVHAYARQHAEERCAALVEALLYARIYVPNGSLASEKVATALAAHKEKQ